jgi:hypothetical protein
MESVDGMELFIVSIFCVLLSHPYKKALIGWKCKSRDWRDHPIKYLAKIARFAARASWDRFSLTPSFNRGNERLFYQTTFLRNS